MMEKEALTHNIKDDLDARNRNWDKIDEKFDIVDNTASEVANARGDYTTLGERLDSQKEDYVNYQNDNNLKIASIERELNNYKSTMANVNINQEAKQSATGYGVVSLPKNAANGQVSVSVKGNTETDEEGNTKSTQSAMRLKSAGKNLVNPNKLAIGVVYSTNNTLYPSRITSHNYDNTTGRLAYTTTQNVTGVGFTVKIKPNTLYTYKYTPTKNCGKHSKHYYDKNMNFLFGRTIWNSNSTELSPENAEYVTYGIIPLALGDVVAESIQIEEGEKSTTHEPYTESNMYIQNVGELRSLPNGVKDEVRVSGGKAELIKRVSDTMEELAEPIVTPIETSGTLLSYPSGSVWLECAIPDAGVYKDKMTLLYQSVPIKEIEWITKVDFATGVETVMDVSKAVIAGDGKSFTHPDLVNGDIVFFTYFYDETMTTTGGLTVEYYDSRHTLKDTVTGKFYKVVPTVADGVLTNELVEV